MLQVEDFFVPYFPTLKLYYPKTKKYVDYDGELNAESLGEFLKQRVQHGHDDLWYWFLFFLYYVIMEEVVQVEQVLFLAEEEAI